MVVSNIIVLCFKFFFFVLCTLMFPVYLDSPFVIAPSVLSNVYLKSSINCFLI